MTILNNRKVIIFSEPFHASKIAYLYKKQDTTVIAFSIDGKVALEKIGVRCYFSDDFISLPDLNQIGIDNLERVKKMCNFLDKKLQEKNMFLKENNINLLSANNFYIKIFFDNLYTSYFILDKLIKEINIKELILIKNRSHFHNVVIGEGNLVTALIENVFSKRFSNIKVISTNGLALKKIIMSKLRNLNNIRRIISPFKREQITPKKYGIVVDYRYDIPHVVNDILKDINFFKLIIDGYFAGFKSVNSNYCNSITIRKIFFDKKGIVDSIKEIFKEILTSRDYRDMFNCEDEVFIFTNLCIENYLIVEMARLLPYGPCIKEQLSRLAPVVMLTSACRLKLGDAFLLEIGRSLKIPVVTYQESGGAGYVDWPLFNLDVDLSDYFLVYGKGVKESPFIKKGRAEVIPVGSIYLDQIKRNVKNSLPSQETIYVVMDNIKTDTNQHYPYNGGLFSRSYKHQLRILNTLKQFSDVKFVIKTVKGKELLYEKFTENNFISIETRPLSTVLDNASAFILEYPSTVLQECLLTSKPIALFYNKSAVKFEPRALDLLSRRVRISSNPDEFSEIIRLLINDVKYGSKMVEDNEFRDRYCLMNDTERNLKIFFDNLFKNNKKDK